VKVTRRHLDEDIKTSDWKLLTVEECELGENLIKSFYDFFYEPEKERKVKITQQGESFRNQSTNRSPLKP
jgi:hypothetical protein